MPATLAARKSPANLATTMSTLATNSDVSTTTTNIVATSSTSSTFVSNVHSNTSSVSLETTPSTCTFPASVNSDYRYLNTQHQQQQQQQQQHYYHNLHPPLPSSSIENSTSFVTFNGNSNVSMANGNVANSNDSNSNSNNKNNGNGNSNNSSTTNSQNFVLTPNDGSIGSAELTTTSSSLSSSSTVTVGSGPVVSGVSNIRKTSSSHAMQLHASREDITSLGGASSLNSQLSLVNNSNSNSSSSTSNSNSNSNNGSSCNGGGNNNNNINSSSNEGNGVKLLSNSKESKDSLPQNYFNGTGSVSASGSVEGGSITGGGAGGSLSSRNTDNDDPGDGLGPLPPKWETAYTERGELYFIDHNTGTSHWLDPRLSKFQKKSLEDCGDDELPYGWEKIEDSLYGTYYIDHVNRRTQYENPVLEAKRRAAEQKQQKQQTQEQRSQTPSTIHTTNSNGTFGKNDITDPPGGGILNRRPMHPPPPLPLNAQSEVKSTPALFPYKFTRNPADMRGERIMTTLVKSARGLGIKIVGGDDGVEEFLQIKSIVPHGPAWQDGQLLSGDVLVYVNDTCVLGFTHHEMVNVFQSILPGDTVTLEVCRGYPLPFDPNDPNTEVVTTIAVDTEPEKQRRLLRDFNVKGNYNFHEPSSGQSMIANKATMNSSNSLHHLYHPKTSDGFILMKKPEVHSLTIIKGAMGFGFTIADSGFGQKVKKILDRNCCTHLQEGDILLEINNISVRNKSHMEVVQMLKDCSKTEPTTVKIQRAAGSGNENGIAASSISPNSNVAKLRKNFIGNTATGLFRSKTPTAEIYSTQQKEILPMRPKTPLVDTRRARVKTPNNELNDAEVAAVTGAAGVLNDSRSLSESKNQVDGKSTNSLQEIDAINQEIPFMDPYPKLVTSLSERLAETSIRDNAPNSRLGYHGTHVPHPVNYENQEYATASNHSGSYNPIYGLTTIPPPLQLNPVQLSSGIVTTPLQGQLYPSPNTLNLQAAYHQQHQQYPHDESCICYDCQDFRSGNKIRQTQQYYGYQAPSSLTPLGSYNSAQYSPGSLQAAHIQNERMQKRVNELLSDRRRVGFSPLDVQAHQSVSTSSHLPAGYLHHHQPPIQNHSPAMSSNSLSQQQHNQHQPWPSPNQTNMGMGQHLHNGVPLDVSDDTEQYELSEVTLERQAMGFGFRIVGGTEEGSQVTVGHVVPGGAADNDHRINTGDEILSIDGVNVVNSSHHKVVSLMGEAALRGQVSMILRRRLNPRQNDETLLHQQSQKLLPTPTSFAYTHEMSHQMPLRSTATSTGLLYYPYDVVVSRHENEGFGFVIISSSNQFYGSTIGKLIPGSPADRCGELKVGDRIIAVNRIDIAGMSHGEVVSLIKESGLHVRLTIGCPKDGNVMQISPGQHSQTHLSQTTPLHTGDNSSLYFERPTTGMAIRSAAEMSPKQQQQQHQQQEQQPHQQPQL